MGHLQSFREDFILFLEAGFIAVNQADEDSARKLFKAAALSDPKSTLPSVGLGYMHLHKLEIKEACSYFEKVLNEEPQNEMAKTFLGLCLSMSTTEVSKGEKILEEMARSSDNMVKSLSHDALNFVDKFVKRAPSPLEINQSKPTKKKSKSK